MADGRGLCQLAHIGLNRLITDEAMRSAEGNSTSSGLLSSDCVSAVLLLPQLESIIEHGVDELRRSSTQSSHAVSPTCSSRASADSSIELRACDKTAAALIQLLTLVRYSRHVRQAITSGYRANDDASKTDDTIPVPVSSFNSGTVLIFDS